MKELRLCLLQAQTWLLYVMLSYSFGRVLSMPSFHDSDMTDYDTQISHTASNDKHQDASRSDDNREQGERKYKHSFHYIPENENIQDIAGEEKYLWSAHPNKPAYSASFPLGFTDNRANYIRTVVPSGQFYRLLQFQMPIVEDGKGYKKDINSQNLFDQPPIKRRKREIDSPKNENIKRLLRKMDSGQLFPSTRDKWNFNKRSFGMGSSGFHGDTFNDGWGTFTTMKKRRPEWDSSGFHGDVFSDGFGSFYTMKKRVQNTGAANSRSENLYPIKHIRELSSIGVTQGGDNTKKESFNSGFFKLTRIKRLPEMTSSGFHGDTFSSGFGDFYTMKRANEKVPLQLIYSRFNEDALPNEYDTQKKIKSTLSHQHRLTKIHDDN